MALTSEAFTGVLSPIRTLSRFLSSVRLAVDTGVMLDAAIIDHRFGT
jgi:hypothetical protein